MLTSNKMSQVPPNIQLQLLKTYTDIEEKNAKNWKSKWGWILGEYKDLKNRLKQRTDVSEVMEKAPITDPRKILPVPKSVNHEYGWVCSKPEFCLQIYGPDVPNRRIPEKYCW
ncbi:Normal lung function maintenance, Low in Lung Cancer 1 protein [Popillia japonica]|uniref:Normal lung function maintenance, Low in Lung Cancer 1 protein n=1 Tax=Popillia japonica TaxID=7064 RepID=A0AAW1LDN9_POPJA